MFVFIYKYKGRLKVSYLKYWSRGERFFFYVGNKLLLITNNYYLQIYLFSVLWV